MENIFIILIKLTILTLWIYLVEVRTFSTFAEFYIFVHLLFTPGVQLIFNLQVTFRSRLCYKAHVLELGPSPCSSLSGRSSVYSTNHSEICHHHPWHQSRFWSQSQLLNLKCSNFKINNEITPPYLVNRFQKRSHTHNIRNMDTFKVLFYNNVGPKPSNTV